MWGHAWLIAANGLRRSLRDRSILIQAVVAPILIAMVVGAAFGGGFSVQATIGVADADGSQISRQVAQGLIGASGDGIGFSTVTDPQASRAMVEAGTYDAVIVLPEGLGKEVLDAQPAELTVIGKDEIGTSIAQAVAQSTAARLQTARVAATAAQDLDVDPLSAIVEASEQPSPIVVEQGGVTGTFSVMAYFAPGIAMLFLFFIIGNGARSIIAERREGTLARILAAPVQPSSVLLGKTVSVLIVGVVSMVAVWLITWLLFGASWGDPVAVFVVIVAAVSAIAGISLLITGLARTENQADALTTIVALLFAVAGGTFFYGAGGAMEQMRLLTPNGQALAAFVDLSAARSSLLEVMPRVLFLFGIGVLCAGIGIAALRRKVLA